MKHFLINLIKFLPIVFIIAVTNIVVDPANIYTKKYEKEMAELLLSGKNIAGLKNYDERLLQKELIQKENICPDTIIIGSSRVMTLSDEAIDIENYRNHGMSGAGLWDYMGILGLYESTDKMPNHIIIGLDPWVLNENSGDARYQSLAPYIDNFKESIHGRKNLETKNKKRPSLEKKLQLLSIPYFQSSIKEVLKAPKSVLKWGGKRDFYGTEERNVEEAIYYVDGSMEYNREYREKDIERVNADAKAYVTGNIYQIENFDSLSEAYCIELEKIIDYLQARGVQLVFYLPPYHPYVYKYIETNEKYQMVLRAEEYFRDLGLEKGIAVYGSYNPELLGCTEKDFLDGMHLKRCNVSASWKKMYL